VNVPVGALLSTRQLLAHTALPAALTVDGVLAGTSGRQRMYVTPAGRELLQGVTVAAQGAGRYSVDVYLVCRPVALWPLAERVREQIRHAAMLAGLDDRLGRVSVHIEDVEAAP
jgi:hypothetical protein